MRPRRSGPYPSDAVGRFSCVIDDHPRFHLEALRWFTCLTELAGVDPADLVVHVVGPRSTDVLTYLRTRGVTVRGVERFDPRSPHCNKIAAALALAEDGVDGVAVLTDTDVAFLEDPRQLCMPGDAVAGKPVDAPVPPRKVIEAVFDAAGLERPAGLPLPWGDGGSTVSGNFNGGLYLVPGGQLGRVSSAWSRWARWLLDRSELLEEWAVYVDQVAMALGLADARLVAVTLDVQWNTPIHDPGRIPAHAPVPAMIHYHQQVDEGGNILRTGIGSIDGQVDRVNEAIGAAWRQTRAAPALRRWSTRADAPRVPTEYERRCRTDLDRLVTALHPESVLEAGCGGSAVTDGLALPGYRGLDSSAALLGRAEAGRPDGDHLLGSLPELPFHADLTVCFDLSDHLGDASDPRSLVEALWRSADRALVVTGPERPGGADRAGGHGVEPLSASLARAAPDAEVYPLSHHGPLTTFVVLRPPPDRHPRDYTPATLAALVDGHPDPLTLVALRLSARETTGFYPDHAPRLWEYPVAASLVTDALPAGSRLVDVGAGVTPLTPYLSGLGYVVDTVDPSPVHRTWPPRPDWNEWDFLDYGAAGLAHRSWNCTIDRLPVRPPFDGAYSISVIEHVPADTRRALLVDLSARVRVGGLVILTIDLVRDTDDLWNRNLGVEVEDPAVHGTLQDVVRECAAVGLELFRQESVRGWGDTHVDIGLLALRKTRSPAGPGRSARAWWSSVRRGKSPGRGA